MADLFLAKFEASNEVRTFACGVHEIDSEQSQSEGEE